ncbi:MAG TPA: hypothetical protein VLA68_05870 [Nitrososphaera sp.]|nr:hypothetical protein [Nitrososphaera sp.]
MYLEGLAKSGAIVSAAGVTLLVAFVAILLIFPVVKECPNDGNSCAYTSTAPEPFKSIVQPGYLALALLVIAGGVFIVRFSRWREPKETGG